MLCNNAKVKLSMLQRLQAMCFFQTGEPLPSSSTHPSAFRYSFRNALLPFRGIHTPPPLPVGTKVGVKSEALTKLGDESNFSFSVWEWLGDEAKDEEEEERGLEWEEGYGEGRLEASGDVRDLSDGEG